MTQVSILQGAYLGGSANYRISYPINMEPVVGETGFSAGFLRTAPGVTFVANGPGRDRGAIMWYDGAHFRVMGTKLVYLPGGGVIQTLGDVGDDGNPVSLDYGPDRVCVASNGKLYYYVLLTLVQVTDSNLGTVLDVIYIDGYYMTTDGTYLVVTELNDPMTVKPLKYGSSEADPDPIVGLRRVRDEVYVLNTNTIENFQNVGGEGFPFQRNPGGLIPKGVCGTHAASYFLDSFAFVGNGRNEALSVYIAGYGQAENISTPEIDRQLATLTITQQRALETDSITDRGEQRFLIHLPNKTLVYYRQASLAAQKPVWSILAGGANMDQAYPAKHFAISSDGTRFCGSASGQLGYRDDTVQTQFGAATTWQFDTQFLYNGGLGGIVKSAELVGTPGLSPSLVSPPNAYASWTSDGHTWSAERSLSMGLSGQYSKRMQWRPKTRLRDFMGMRFRGPDAAVVGFGRLEVDIEPLNA